MQALAQVLHIVCLAVAQLRLNRPDLFAQVIILLVFFDLLPHALLHLFFNRGQLRLAGQDGAQRLQPVPDVAQLKDSLPVRRCG